MITEFAVFSGLTTVYRSSMSRAIIPSRSPDQRLAGAVEIHDGVRAEGWVARPTRGTAWPDVVLYADSGPVAGIVPSFSMPAAQTTPGDEVLGWGEEAEVRFFYLDLNQIHREEDTFAVFRFAETYEPLGGQSDIILYANAHTYGGAVMDRQMIEDAIAVSEAKTETKFERLLRELQGVSARQDSKFDQINHQSDLLNQRLAGVDSGLVQQRAEIVESRHHATNVAITIGFALAALIVGLATYGDAIFGRGMSVRDVVSTTAREQEERTKAIIDKAVQDIRAASQGKTPPTTP